VAAAAVAAAPAEKQVFFDFLDTEGLNPFLKVSVHAGFFPFWAGCFFRRPPFGK
jgi:hypothetical protein